MTDPRDLIQRLLVLSQMAVDAALEYDYGDPEDRHIYRELQELDSLATAYLNATPEPAAGPTDEELLHVAASAVDPYESCGIAPGEYEAETECAVEVYGSELIAFARAVLSRYGHQPPQPIPLSERLPGAEDCDAEEKCWWFVPADPEVGMFGLAATWVLRKVEPDDTEWGVTHYLPHHALPLPEGRNPGRRCTPLQFPRMTNPTSHRATPEQWKRLKRWVANNASSTDSITLELADRLATAEQRISELEGNSSAGLTGSNHPESPDSSAPAGSLVEAVQRAISDVEFPHGSDEARAAILAVADHLAQTGALGSNALAQWLRMEVERD